MAGENGDFVAWVRTQRCRMWLMDACKGPVEAHHAGERGLGQRAHDETCIPLCNKHHRAWHDASGVFKTWRKNQRRDWVRRQIRWAQTAWNNRPIHPLTTEERRALIAERAAQLRKEPQDE